MSKMELFSAFAMGRVITLEKPATRVSVTGTIMGITLESGFTPPDSPHCFNVQVLIGRAGHPNRDLWGTTLEIFVRTID